MPNWNIKNGDLIFDNKKIEVKGFCSNGPSSFGPSESWEYIYFVDCCDYLNKKFKVYEIKLSNYSKEWKNIKINSKQTYEDMTKLKNRGILKIHFNKIKEQIDKYIKLIFDDNIDNI